MHETILGYPVWGAGIARLYRETVRMIDNDEKFYVCCLNAHSYMVSRRDPVFRASLLNSGFIIPDGFGVTLASRVFFDGQISETIPGPDFFDYFCSKSAEEGKSYKHFFLGSTPDTLGKLVKNVSDAHGIDVVGTCSPPFMDSFSDEDNAEMRRAINEYEVDILWVGMTAPKQEKWIYQNLDKLNVRLAVGVGAAFDFRAGTVKRAPAFLRRLGLEGYHRLFFNPIRLSNRVMSDPLFMCQAFKEFLRKKIGR